MRRAVFLLATMSLAAGCSADGTMLPSECPNVGGDACTPATIFTPDAGNDDPIKVGPDAGMHGGTCECQADEACEEATGACIKRNCQPASAKDLCLSSSFFCGTQTVFDACQGLNVAVDCGGCAANWDCVGGRCVCVPESDGEFCAAAGRACGVYTDLDRCVAPRKVQCGFCATGEACDSTAGACRALVPCGAGQACPAYAPKCVGGTCGECALDADCPQGVCDPRLHRCVDCALDSDCVTPPAFRCVPETGTCVECLSGADCASGACDPARHACTPPHEANDDCSGAALLPAGGAAGDTAAATASTSGSCGGGTGDLVYAAPIAAEGWYDVSVATTSATFRPVVHVRTRCADPSTELGCAVAEGPGLSATASVRLPKGLAYLWVDGRASRGAFSLSVQPGATPPPPPNDTCTGAIALGPLEPGTPRAATGDTRPAGDHLASASTYSDGPDVAYSFTLGSDRKVTATVEPVGSPAYRPSVYLLDACGSAGVEQAFSPPASSGPARAVAGRLASGSHLVVVDGAQRSAGAFKLELVAEEAEPMADQCPGLEIHRGDTVSADTRHATNQGTGACGGSGPDAVYRLVVGTAATFGLTLRRAAGDSSGDLRPVLHVRQGTCADPAQQIACEVAPAGDEAGLSIPSLPLPAGTTYLWVDGLAGTSGAYTLTVR